MKIVFNTLAWSNIDDKMMEGHKSVYEHFDIPIAYTRDNYDHGEWMDYICQTEDADLFVFFDVDCIPLNETIINSCIEYCSMTGGFVGPAQASNHYGPPIPSHVFASPAFFMMPKTTYQSLNCPTFRSVQGRSDVGQEVSRVADEMGVPYHCLYPTKYERGLRTSNPLGYDKLGNYGRYGIGTVYGNDDVYHLYEGRTKKNVDKFVERCSQVIEDSFDSTDMNSCNSLLP